MKHPFLVFSLVTLLCSSSIYAQEKVTARATLLARVEGSVGYLLFTGPDAGSFTTSVKGFGSGLQDFINTRESIEMVSIGTSRINLTTGIGNNISKYRLAQNLVPALSESGIVSFIPDPDAAHNYVNTFFGYGKTKLVTSSMYIPLNLNIRIGKEFQLTVGAFADWLFFAKYKMKYLVEDLKVKEVIASPDMLKFPFNRYRFGLHAGIFNSKLNMGLAGTYYITPLFETGMGPEINECRLTIQYGITDILKEIRNRKNKKDD